MKSFFVRIGLLLINLCLSGLLFFLLYKLMPSLWPFFFVVYVLLALFIIVVLFSSFSKKTHTFSKEFSSFEEIPTNFNNIYENLYQNKIHTLESMRKQIMWKRIL